MTMIVKAALLLFRGHVSGRQLLFVRPKGKSYYVFPGGKQEAGESVEEALLRELREELAVDATNVKKIGELTGATPNGTPLQMHLYSASLVGDPQPHSEIEELLWLTKVEAVRRKSEMTPMSLEHVFPFGSPKTLGRLTFISEVLPVRAYTVLRSYTKSG